MEQENIEQQIEELKAKCDEYLSGWKRERADFLNYKKEEGERIGTLAKFSNEELLLNILPILDNLLLASAHIKDDGLSQVVKQFQDFLAKEGIEPIEVADKNFDPNTMDAVDGEGEKVSEELQKGYTLHGKLIRPARVKLEK
jgi:molecular chaperone GrpE